MVVPTGLRNGLMREMHGGRFSRHFVWKKIIICNNEEKVLAVSWF